MIVEEFCTGKIVLDIGCVQHDIANVNTESWLHHQIVQVAADVLGVDYLEAPVRELIQRGYKCIQGDVNKPLAIDRAFDVIVVGNLIEHLSNFEGLMHNLNRLLKPDGVVLISTANPFYCDQYFYSAFRNDIIVNPEHTCWIDPVTLNQLSLRFGLETVQVHWIKERWRLEHGVIFNDDRNQLDIFTGRWKFDAQVPRHERLAGAVLKALAKLLLPASRLEHLKHNHGRDLNRFLFITVKARLFGVYWRIRRLFIPISDINRFELYMSVLRKTRRAPSSEALTAQV